MYAKPSQTSERKNILRRGVLRGLNVSTHGKPTGPRYHSILAESVGKIHTVYYNPQKVRGTAVPKFTTFGVYEKYYHRSFTLLKSSQGG
jgi:hypothetical protein